MQPINGAGMAKAKKTVAPYGLWASPIKAASVAMGARRFGHIQGDGDWVYWTEGRPEDKGRQALMRSKPGARAPEELLAAPWSARSRVHEYGGGEFLAAGATIYFVNDADQDVYAVGAKAGSTPRRLTDAPDFRFSDMALDAGRSRLIAVGERYNGPGGRANPENLLVTIRLTGRPTDAVTPLATGRDFYGFPRMSPDGAQLAYLAWDLPDMPWDQAALYVADIADNGELQSPKRIAGGNGVAIMQPTWLSDGHLMYISDETGWGNLAVWDGRRIRALTKLKAELGMPMWNLAARSIIVDGKGAAHAATMIDGAPSLVSIADPAANKPPVIAGVAAVTSLGHLSACTSGIVATIGRAKAPSAIAVLPAGRRAPHMLRTASDMELDPAGLSVGAQISFKGGDGATTFAQYYPPSSATHAAPKDARPPALILAHGGPTSSASRGLASRIQFYTTRGFAVVDVDYAGSTGYGRKYRERLDGQWGIADVTDCAAAAKFLAKTGLADSARIAIAGGSAGGYTTLMALATTEGVFAAGSSHYGISDLSLLMEHTHKFESGYLHRLLGTTPKAWKKICRERSPLTHISRMTTPVILFQGREDKVVPPEQSRLIADKLKARGIPVELHEFAGEAHGFRRAETIIAVLEAELRFLLAAMKI